MIKSIVIGTVDLGVVTWGQSGHLVSVYGVEAEEEFHFVGNFTRSETALKGPFLRQSHEHGIRSTPVGAPKSAIHRELVVAHPHVLFVRLSYLSILQWLELSSRRSSENSI